MEVIDFYYWAYKDQIIFSVDDPPKTEVDFEFEDADISNPPDWTEWRD